MISQEIMQRIKEIEISTRRIMASVQLGNVKPIKKGAGFEFDQIRAYEMGDDVRFIDWKSTARSSQLLVRQYLEERNRTIILCVDTSSSMFFSSTETLKFELAANVAATLGLVGIYRNDNVGLVTFSDKIEKVIAPGKGKNHAYQIMNTLFSITPAVAKKSSLSVCAHYLQSLPEKRALIFVISDFFAPFEQGIWNSLQQRKEIIAIRCLDKEEEQMSASALIWMQDMETDKKMLVPTASLNIQNALKDYQSSQKELLRKVRIDCIDLDTKHSFVDPLIAYFKHKRLS